MNNLPVLHPSQYIDPLKASDEKRAVGVPNSHGVLMAIGDENTQEWIRMESSADGYAVKQ